MTTARILILQAAHTKARIARDGARRRGRPDPALEARERELLDELTRQNHANFIARKRMRGRSKK